MDNEHADVASPTSVADDGVLHPVLHHVNIKTTRMGALIDWYGAVIGMRPTFRGADTAFLTNDVANHRLALIGTAGLVDDPDKVTHTGMHHSAFEFASLGDLLTRYRTLADARIVPHFCLDHGPTISFYYLDPDGNVVELQADNFSDWALSTHLMRTSPAFQANPVGIPIDPVQLSEAEEQGLSVAELHERAYRGEYPPEGPVDLRLPAAE